MRMMIVLWVAVTWLITGVAARAAENQDQPAKEAYGRGKAAFAEGRFDEAAKEFREANRLKPSWRIYYNIAQAEAAGKRYGLALEAFEKYLSEGGDDVEAERQSEVLSEVARLRNLVGYIKVSAPEGTTVAVDGELRGTAPIFRELPVAASVRHTVTATAEGAVVGEETVQVSGGRTVQVALTAKTEPAVTEPVASPETQPSPTAAPVETVSEGPSADPGGTKGSRLRIIGWATTGVGAAVLIGGVVTAGLAMSKEGDLKDNCSNGTCPEEYLATQDQRDNLALATDILLPVGGVIAAAGITMVLVGLIQKRNHQTETAVRVRPLPVPGNAGLMLEGRF
jgi:hypothetical protein